MKTYLITYDILSPKAADVYSRITETIENNFDLRCKPLESVWIIVADISIEELGNIILDIEEVDNGDKVLIADVSESRGWGLLAADENWLKKNS